jgi:adenylate cyclase, class 2
MEEIEVKILDINVNRIIGLLYDMGAKEVFNGEINASYYDYPDERLKKNGECLRLRTKGDKVEFTYKGTITKEEVKAMNELEVNVSNLGILEQMLLALGFEKTKEQIKHRSSYRLGEVSFEFDTLPNLPTYLEIEAPNRELLQKSVERLGYSMKDTKPWTGGDVIRHYAEKN